MLDRFGDRPTYRVENKKPMPGRVAAVIEAIRERGLIDHVITSAIYARDRTG